jgi:hypothetical protein
MSTFLESMLLIKQDSTFKLYQELKEVSYLFVGPLFVIALIFEFLGDCDFLKVIKKLAIILLVLTSFYEFHSEAVALSFEVANKTFKKVSPKNIFTKKWYVPKLETKKATNWNYIKSIAIPNLNDLVATSFYVLSQIFMWLLKLIYSSVYHLTYIFASFSALLYFFSYSDKSLMGTIQSSLWCIVFPFVLIALLSLVGTTMEAKALKSELIASDIETIMWLFGVTLLLLLTPMISWTLVRGGGIAASGAQMGALTMFASTKVMSFATQAPRLISSVKNSLVRNGANSLTNIGRSLFNSSRSNQSTLNKNPTSSFANTNSSQRYDGKPSSNTSTNYHRDSASNQNTNRTTPPLAPNNTSLVNQKSCNQAVQNTRAVTPNPSQVLTKPTERPHIDRPKQINVKPASAHHKHVKTVEIKRTPSRHVTRARGKHEL